MVEYQSKVKVGSTTMRWLCLVYAGLITLVVVYASMGAFDLFTALDILV